MLPSALVRYPQRHKELALAQVLLRPVGQGRVDHLRPEA